MTFAEKYGIFTAYFLPALGRMFWKDKNLVRSFGRYMISNARSLSINFDDAATGSKPSNCCSA